jgi:uroporphyrinogen decarboxylase
MEALLDIDIPAARRVLQGGAPAICYFDPLASPTATPPEVYRLTGWRIAKRCLARIAGPTATHPASGRCLPVIDHPVRTGTAAIGVGSRQEVGGVSSCTERGLVVQVLFS